MTTANDKEEAPIDAFCGSFSCWTFWRWRQQLVSPQRGRVLEIGCGTGPTFRHYHPSCEVWAVEKEMERCQQALATAQTSAARVQVQQGSAQALPFPSGFFDSVLSCLVLCSVPSQTETLEEIRRVLRPTGTFSILEHVLPLNRHGARLANLIQPWWSAQLDNCQPNRESDGILKKLGWQAQQFQRTACVIRGTFAPPAQIPKAETP